MRRQLRNVNLRTTVHKLWCRISHAPLHANWTGKIQTPFQLFKSHSHFNLFSSIIIFHFSRSNHCHYFSCNFSQHFVRRFLVSKGLNFSHPVMADRLMHAVQYDSYGGGAAALKVPMIFPSFPLFQCFTGLAAMSPF